jgi:DnaJ-class molecular chaperone
MMEGDLMALRFKASSFKVKRANLRTVRTRSLDVGGQQQCLDCEGTGKKDGHQCEKCHGTGNTASY